MDEALLGLITGLVSGAITAVVTYYSTFAKARLDVSIEYDKELRQKRLTAYQDLWARLKPIARFSLEEPITYKVIENTSQKMRDWYFDIGGIYLSRESRTPYFNLKEAMQKIIDDPKLQATADAPLDAALIKPVQKLGTNLREVLSDDIGTRRGPLFESE